MSEEGIYNMMISYFFNYGILIKEMMFDFFELWIYFFFFFESKNERTKLDHVKNYFLNESSLWFVN